MTTDSNDIDKTTPVKKKSGSRRKRVLIPLFILIVLVVAGYTYWYYYLRGYVSTDDAYIDGDAITISSKILGRVKSLAVDEGDSVIAGQLLVRLDDSDLQAQNAEAAAALEYTKESVPVAKITLDRAQDDFQRANQQYNDGVITREEFDHARQAVELARAQYNVAQSHVKSTEAQLAVIGAKLAHTRIEAPMAGIVARKWVVLGDIVQAGQPIYTVYDLDSVWVTANLEETKLASIHLGDSVEISIDAYPDHPIMGKVDFIGAAAASQFSLIPPDNASGNFTKVTQRVPIRISLNANLDPAGQGPFTLRPGMSVEVKIRKRVK